MLKIPNIDVYLKDNIPVELHYNGSDRIGNYRFFNVIDDTNLNKIKFSL